MSAFQNNGCKDTQHNDFACGFVWDHRRNEDVLGKLSVKQIIEYVKSYQSKGKEHVNRMNRGRIPKQILSYQPRGQRSIERQ
jgi:hypothetical protein